MSGHYRRTSPYIKLVTVGDGAVGKTCLLTTYCTERFPTDYVPTTFDSWVSNVTLVNGQQCDLAPWDTAGQSDYDRLRPLAYPDTDVLLLCFAVDQPSSYYNVETKWYPELSRYCPDVPIILVGTKLDLREDKECSTLHDEQSVFMKMGLLMQEKSDNVVRYMECSALTNYGVKEVFEEAMTAGIIFQNQNNQSSRKCCCVL